MKIKDFKNIGRIKWAIKEKVMHFAPTISPAPKNIEANEIESIKEAVEYYFNAGIERLILQPKYMGSYCDILLTKDINNTVFFSRKGYLIDHISRDKLIAAVMDAHNKTDWTKLNKILLQSELLPWSALGEKLIERDFKSYLDVNKIHSNYLSESGIFSKIEKIKREKDYIQYTYDKDILERKKLIEKYHHHKVKSYEATDSFFPFDTDQYKNSIDIYSEQLDFFGKTAENFEFKIFNWLKKIYADGTEEINEDNISGYTAYNSDEYFVVESLNDIDDAYKYFNRLVGNNMEGIVIKPQTVYIKENLAPMLKVRNRKYLTLIYGTPFERDYNYYLNKRSVHRKMKASVNEWKISQNMLKIVEKDISENNELYIDLIEKRIYEEEFEEKLDSRL